MSATWHAVVEEFLRFHLPSELHELTLISEPGSDQHVRERQFSLSAISIRLASSSCFFRGRRGFMPKVQFSAQQA